MRILFDTNILLDVFLQREPFYSHSATLMGLAESNKIEGWICGTTVTTIHYLLEKSLPHKEAKKHLKALFQLFHIATVNRLVLEDALESGFNDYEDAVLYQSALHAGLSGIVTRNRQDFSKSELPVYDPKELLKAIELLGL